MLKPRLRQLSLKPSLRLRLRLKPRLRLSLSLRLRTRRQRPKRQPTLTQQMSSPAQQLPHQN